MASVRLVSLHIVGACWLAGTLAGCASASFDSPDSAARIRAIRNAAREDDRQSIPRLIEMLESDDPAVRLLAIRTLESMTGKTFEYDYSAPSLERAEAVDRWQQWYRGEEATPKHDEAGREQAPNERGALGRPGTVFEEVAPGLRSKGWPGGTLARAKYGAGGVMGAVG